MTVGVGLGGPGPGSHSSCPSPGQKWDEKLPEGGVGTTGREARTWLRRSFVSFAKNVYAIHVLISFCPRDPEYVTGNSTPASSSSSHIPVTCSLRSGLSTDSVRGHCVAEGCDLELRGHTLGLKVVHD